MTKAEIIEKLLASGKTEEELEGLKKPELEALLPSEEDGELFQINSKRRDGSNCYWLEGTDEKVKFEDVKDFFKKDNDLAPPHKAKDYAKKVNGKWELLFRNEVEK